MNPRSPVCLSARMATDPRAPRGLLIERAVHGTLDDARAYIDAYFYEPLTVAQLADLCSLSVSRFATAFRERFEDAPYRYLCRVRVAAAQRLLLAGVPGSLVATEVGFFDQSHLARHFKRVCGMTPSAFVQHHLRDERHTGHVTTTRLTLGPRLG
ncbi:AraC family transcriptional regulator [Pandoraea horticolens]|uniref:AraC family transcriptional regulator n=2 Tax=Pandoraea horticolens TaxID=2508298 RepID=A0A5E4UTP4_9BURK|nr:AraC family transcriptional regulator [Pandoraea horticolens]